ncbi:MAG: hypothetical protein MI919_05800, partial [Holophagales bacterium]|nr:hypothetical protein [Holophagales bacterium]
MREDLLPLLRCPESAEPLELARVERWFALDDPSATGQARRHVVTGLLRGRGPVAHAYPILDEIPRLVPQALLSAD